MKERGTISYVPTVKSQDILLKGAIGLLDSHQISNLPRTRSLKKGNGVHENAAVTTDDGVNLSFNTTGKKQHLQAV